MGNLSITFASILSKSFEDIQALIEHCTPSVGYPIMYISIVVIEFIRQVKGFSSHRTGRDFGRLNLPYLQSSKRNLPTIIAYIRNQREHHTRGRVYPTHEPPGVV
jgi:hypothetical protein